MGPADQTECRNAEPITAMEDRRRHLCGMVEHAAENLLLAQALENRLANQLAVPGPQPNGPRACEDKPPVVETIGQATVRLAELIGATEATLRRLGELA